MSALVGVLGMGRVQAAGRFTETFEFFTEVEGHEGVTATRTPTVSATGVAGRVKFPSLVARSIEAGGQSTAVNRLEVHVAVGSHAAGEGELVKVLTSTVDAGLVGRTFRVLESPVMGQVTAWRASVEDYGRSDV